VDTTHLEAVLGTVGRPSWRGRLHLFALCAAVPAMAALVVSADGTRIRVGVVVYAVGVCSMLAVSTTYHRWVHTRRARMAWQRADHATIFAAIAGTFTAICLACMTGGWVVATLIAVWTAAILGASLKATGRRRPCRIAAGLYLVIGWAGLLLVPAIWATGGWLTLVLLLAGGVAYTVGAIAFAFRWPTLRPATFSYHEVWHAWTVAAAALHLGAVWTVAS
jgi:hemolysin III